MKHLLPLRRELASIGGAERISQRIFCESLYPLCLGRVSAPDLMLAGRGQLILSPSVVVMGILAVCIPIRVSVDRSFLPQILRVQQLLRCAVVGLLSGGAGDHTFGECSGISLFAASIKVANRLDAAGHGQFDSQPFG